MNESVRFFSEVLNLDLIFLIGPTTTKYRIEKMLVHGSGFIYLVIKPGVTGMQTEMSNSTKELTHDLINKVKSNLPKVVGFGISNEKQVTEIISAGGNGAIVGSAFVNIIADGIDVLQRLEMLTRRLSEKYLKSAKIETSRNIVKTKSLCCARPSLDSKAEIFENQAFPTISQED